jgi:hypothetical protein
MLGSNIFFGAAAPMWTVILTVTAVDAFYLPRRTFLWSEPARIIVDDDTISVVSRKDDRVLFRSSLKELHTGEDQEMNWTVLSDGTAIVRILFSDPSKARNLAFVVVGVIIVGLFTSFPATLALLFSFIFFRPWLGRQENNSEARGEFIGLLKASTHAGEMALNVAAVDDLTLGTNRLLGGWRELFSSVTGALISSILLTISYFVGIYGAERRPGYLFFVVFGVSFTALLGYYVVIARRTSVEYFKMKRAENNTFGRYATLVMLPLLIAPVVFVYTFITVY